MTDEQAIFAHLTTLKLRCRVTNAESQPPTFCKLCRQVHGYGNRN